MNLTADQLKKIMSSSLGVDVSKISEDSSMKSLMEWDSLGHLAILNAVDSHFNGQLGDLSDLGNKDNFADLLKTINAIDLKHD